MPLKVLSIFGTRPEAIKLAPVIRALRARSLGTARDKSAAFEPRICVTGQHRELLEPVLRLFDIEPDFDLQVMTPDQSLYALTAHILIALEPILAAEKPDWVLVQGDTTTTLAASLAAYYARLPLAHLEAGLRSHDPYRPFPEEQNRRLTDALATLHFAPTEAARQNLLAEGIPDHRIRVTGNTVIDALHDVAARPYNFARPEAAGLAALPFSLDGAGPSLILVTTHRRESFGPPLRALCRAIHALAGRYPQAQFVFPVHLNPNVQVPVREELAGCANVHLLEPLAYQPFVHLLKRATLILSDSGGLQEEAAALQIPVLVLREVSDRPEGVAAGSARVVGTDPEQIVAAATRLLDHPDECARMARVRNPYGDGRASERIVQALLEFSPPSEARRA
ncbi:UDP-N-acetylglucosamine 2-epimerase (non-hydrolyzing) [Acidobacteriia bacterium AH_259_A11_L15]|nr:UDP-N-acetylglucosamine 2-epimerase (non-hydrolyzing) [Acidobacteriia bacterium AH_259_A11_L15]